jgi:hypothetical protein
MENNASFWGIAVRRTVQFRYGDAFAALVRRIVLLLELSRN